MKHIMKKSISLIMVLTLIFCSFTGCFGVGDQSGESMKPVESTKQSNNEDLREEYYNLEAVKHIDDIMSEVIDVPLSDMNDIKELCLQKYTPKYDYINSENIKIIVKGKYNDMYAVVVDDIFQDDTFETVGGYEFGYSFTTPLNFIKNNEMYTLNDVYEKGWITDEDLYELYIRCKYIDYRYDSVDYLKVRNSIMLTMMPSQNSKEFAPEDFSEVNCIKVQDISSQKTLDKGQIGKMLRLYVEPTTTMKLLEYVCILAKRHDVHIVTPSIGSIEWDASPNDTEYLDQDQWAINKIFLPDAWDITTGSSSVMVGIIDSGINTEHYDLIGRVDTDLSRYFYLLEQPDEETDEETDEDNNENCPEVFEDGDGHGSRVAGIIGALSDNNRGMVGVCWDVTLVSLRIEDGVNLYNLDLVADAINYADRNGIPILNASFGSEIDNENVKNAIQNYGGLFVCSAGNDGNDNEDVDYYPANFIFPNIIVVGASDSNDGKWSGSNYGDTSVDLFAPGENILSVSLNGQNNNLYNTDSGTSYAAPYVAGVAALLLSAHPELENDVSRLKQIIMNNVDEISALQNYCVTGGRLNAYKALTDESIHTFGKISNGSSTTHNIVCTCSSCGYVKSQESHNFVCKTVNSNHAVVCRDCGYQSSNEITYTNLGIHSGHRVYCTRCEYTENEEHQWRSMPELYRCLKCGLESIFIPVPGVMSLEILDLIEAKGLTGDFAMAIDEETMLCRVGEDYYYVKADSEAEALALLNSELAVVKPEVQTE